MNRRMTLGRGLRFGWLALVLLVLLTPVVSTIGGSFSATWGLMPWESFTFAWYSYVFSTYGAAVRVSLVVAVCAVVITVPVAILGGYALVRYTFPGRRLLERLLLLPMIVPGLALGLAIVQTYAVLRGQLVLLILGHVVMTIPYALQMIVGSLRVSKVIGLETAAASLGAHWHQRVLLIVLPSLRSSIAAAAVAVATLSLGEFNLSYFLYSPRALPLPVGMYEAYASLRIEIGSAFTTVFLALIVPLVVIGQRLGRGRFAGSV